MLWIWPPVALSVLTPNFFPGKKKDSSLWLLGSFKGGSCSLPGSVIWEGGNDLAVRVPDNAFLHSCPKEIILLQSRDLPSSLHPPLLLSLFSLSSAYGENCAAMTAPSAQIQWVCVCTAGPRTPRHDCPGCWRKLLLFWHWHTKAGVQTCGWAASHAEQMGTGKVAKEPCMPIQHRCSGQEFQLSLRARLQLRLMACQPLPCLLPTDWASREWADFDRILLFFFFCNKQTKHEDYVK